MRVRRCWIIALLIGASAPLAVAAAERAPELAAAYKAREDQCRQQGGAASFGPRFVRRFDLDGDGRRDFVLNDAQVRCSKGAPSSCGPRGCAVEAFLLGEQGAKRVLREIATGVSLRKTSGGAVLTLQQPTGSALRFRFANGCAVPADGQGEPRCGP